MTRSAHVRLTSFDRRQALALSSICVSFGCRSHPDDRHVLAAAIYAQANCIVTFNLRDPPQARLDPRGIEAIHPDELVDLLLDRALDRVLEVASRHRAALRKPPMNAGEYLDALRRAGLEETADRLEDRREEL